MINLNVKAKSKKSLALFLSLFLSVSVFAADISVSGTVIDDFGDPVIGANVVLKGETGVGTITDFDGIYTISVDSKATLLVSYTGYEQQEINVAGQSVIDVALKEESTALDEVVAVGYGSQKKKEITSSVASVSAKDFNAGVKESPMGLLQGKVAGLNISRTGGGDPTNTGYNIQIRGFSTLGGAGTKPLFVVDGVPTDNIDNIAPEEIASMDVLKDGSAAAIYGTRGTNGVILITTKRGSSDENVACGETKVTYSGYVSTAVSTGSTGMASVSEFRDLQESTGGHVLTNLYTSPTGETYDTDWMDEITEDYAITQNHNLAISGATKDFNYRGSVNFKDAGGIAVGSNRTEFITKLAANQKALDGWLDLSYDFSYMHYRNDYNNANFKQASILNPTYPVYDTTSTNGYFQPSGSGQSNPVEAMDLQESYAEGNFYRGSVRGTVNIKPVPGLKAGAFVAIEEGDNYDNWYHQLDYIPDPGNAGRNGNKSFTTLFEATVDYTKQWGKHSLATIAGWSYQHFENDKFSMSNAGFLTDISKYYQLQDGSTIADEDVLMTMSSYSWSNTLAAGFLRANYNYDERYMLSASLRAEGSSRFGENNKWGYFPAASVGWNISREGFMRDVESVDELKLRFGFGITGNDLGSSLKSQLLVGEEGQFWLNGDYAPTYKPIQNTNADLGWETKYEYNLGVDFAFLGNRLSGSLDVYYRQTKDLLWDYPVVIGGVSSVSEGVYYYETLLANAGQVDCKGIELALSGVPIRNENLEWTMGYTMAFNDNVITTLSDPEKGLNLLDEGMNSGSISENGLMNVTTQLITEGESVGVFYGRTVDHTKGEDGIDASGNLIYETDEAGEDILGEIGNAQPLFTFGFSNSVRYKNWDFSCFFRGVVGNDILNVTRWAYSPTAGSNNVNVFMPVAEGVGEGTAPYKQGEFSDYYLEDGSFIKLDNVTVGYNVPLKENKYVESLRVSLTGQNLLTITNYSGLDPEVNTSSVFDSGIDYPSFYPTVMSFQLSASVTF